MKIQFFKMYIPPRHHTFIYSGYTLLLKGGVGVGGRLPVVGERGKKIQAFQVPENGCEPQLPSWLRLAKSLFLFCFS